jgi:glycine cleavage system H lipoate-binding protein
VKQHGGLLPLQSCCPFLQESPAQYCSAASLTKFIPYSQALLSPCGGENHRYCEVYLGLDAGDHAAAMMVFEPIPVHAGAERGAEDMIEGIETPRRLAYSAQHMWLDIAADGSCHIGVDAFLARVLGEIDMLSFPMLKGVDNPAVTLTVRGNDLRMIFPNRMLVTRTNGQLRAKPAKLLSAPYTLGWMFEGTDLEPGEVRSGLIQGADIRPWMRREVQRISEFARARLLRSLPQKERQKVLKTELSGELMRHLGREEIGSLFREFFAPPAHEGAGA